MIVGLGLRVSGLGFKILGLGCTDLKFKVEG